MRGCGCCRRMQCSVRVSDLLLTGGRAERLFCAAPSHSLHAALAAQPFTTPLNSLLCSQPPPQPTTLLTPFCSQPTENPTPHAPLPRCPCSHGGRPWAAPRGALPAAGPPRQTPAGAGGGPRLCAPPQQSAHGWHPHAHAAAPPPRHRQRGLALRGRLRLAQPRCLARSVLMLCPLRLLAGLRRHCRCCCCRLLSAPMCCHACGRVGPVRASGVPASGIVCTWRREMHRAPGFE